MSINFMENQRKTLRKFFAVVVLLAQLCDFNSFASRSACNNALGMQDRRIKDWQIKAYSSDSGYPAKDARLNNNGAWCSDSEKAWTEYLEIRLDRVRHISAIATQGYKHTLFGSYYVKRFSLKYSYDGRVWYWYTQKKDLIKGFIANSDARSVKKIALRDTFVAKILRIYPYDYDADMCMRIELYGCKNDKDCTTVLKNPSDALTSPSYPLNYPKGIDCIWIIQMSDQNKKITLFFENFDVNNGTSPNGCLGDDDDYVEARNGASDTDEYLGRVCNGRDIPIYKTTSNTLRLHFHSGKNSSPRQGFKATYYSDNVLHATACTLSTLTLDCSSSSKSIQILYAAYNTLPFSSTCSSVVSSKTCSAPDAILFLTTKCQYLKVCKFLVTRDLFAVTCNQWQVPLLQVFYQCTGDIIRTPAPEISTTTLSTTTRATTTTTTTTTATTTTITTPITTTPYTTTPTLSTTNHSTSTTIDTTPTPLMSTIEPTINTTSKEPPVTMATEGGDSGETMASARKTNNTTMVVGLVAGLVGVLVVIVFALACFLYKRRKKQYKKPTGGVTYSAPRNNSINGLGPRPRNQSRSQSNAYETVNVLYVSADDPTLKGTEQEHIYDSLDLQLETLPQMTDNPLYHAFDTSVSDANPVYENVDKDNKVPTSLAAIYDSPTEVKKSRAISNPNYGKTVEVIPGKKPGV